MSPATLGVLGAGALGSMIGGTLALAGHRVLLVTRNRAHVEAIDERGLLVSTQADGERVARVEASCTAAGHPPVEVLVVLVKSLDTAAAIAAAGSLIGPSTLVLSLQNGLGTEEPIVARYGPQVAIGRTWVGGQLQGPGAVMGTVAGRRTVVGEIHGGRSARLADLAQRWSAAGIATEVAEDMPALVWEKLIANVATAALSASTGLAYGDLYAVPELARAGQAAVAEAIAVARAAGVALRASDPQRIWHEVGAGLPADFAPSMLQSLRAGARTEIDVINAAVCRLGARLGVPTPVNDTLVATVKGRERAVGAPILLRLDQPADPSAPVAPAADRPSGKA